MKGNALRRFIAVFIVVAMMLTPVLALAEEADLGIEAPVAETGATLGEETTTDNAPEGESAPVEAEAAYYNEVDSEEYDIEITKAGTYSKTVNVGDTISASLDMDDVEITSCSATGSNVIEMDYDETSIEIAAVGAGSAKVTAKLSNKKTVTISVKVVNPYEPKKVSFAESTYTLAVGDLLDLYDEVEYDGITTLTFSTSSKSVATVDKTTGEVVGKKAGKATITVKTSGGKTAKCTVKVVGNELKDIFKKPTKAQIRNLCEGGWTFLPRNIKYNNKGGIDCEFYLLNGTSYKTKTIENLNLSLLVDGEVIAAYDFGSRKVSASKYGYKSFKVSFPASSVEELVFLPYVVEDLLIGVDEDIYVLASNKDELEFIPVDDVHEEGTEPGPTPPTPTPTKVTSVTLSSSTLSLGLGEKSTLVATVKPDNATDKTLNWKSDDEKVATVVDGVVTAVAAGTANITATAKDGSGKSATCAVTVASIVGGLSVTMEETSKTLKVGDTATLTAVVLPPACQDTLVWASSDDTIAKVDSKTGVVTAVKAGSATITATATMGTTTKSASCAITVQGSASKITVDPESAELVVGETLTVKATAPEGKSVTWSSGNTGIATVTKAGVVKGVATGKVRIIASADGESAECIVTVVANTVKDYALDPTEVTVVEAKTATVKVTSITPTGATPASPTFEYEPTGVATCSGFTYDSTTKTGKFTVTGTKAGTTKVTVKIADVKKTFTVTVTAAKVYPTGISLTTTPSPMNLKVGEVGLVGVTYSPSTVTEKDLTYTSSNRSVADYDATEGVVKAYAVGTTHITVKGAAESGKTPAQAEFDVIVTAATKPTSTYPVESVAIEKSAYEATIGGSNVTVKATVNPSYATNPKLDWTISDSNIATITPSSDTMSAKVTPVAEGTVTVIAKSQENGGKYASCKVTVSKKAKKPYSIAIAVKKGTNPIDIGSETKTLQLEATVTYDDGTTDKNVTWKSLDETIATIDSTGLVTGVKASKTKVTITATAGSVTEPYQVEVVEKKHVTSVTVTPTSLTLDVGKTATLSAAVAPDGAPAGLTFDSLNKSIATVTSAGVVSAVAKGKTEIIVTSTDNTKVFAKCEVEVTQPATGIALDKTDPIDLKVGKTQALKATVTPTNANDKTVEWKSDKPAVATVSEDGVITAVAKGSATITAKANGGTNVKATIVVNVTEPAKIDKVKNVVTELNADKSIQVSWDKATAGGDHYWVFCKQGGTEVYKTHVDNINTTTATIPVKDGTKTILESGKDYEVTVQTTIGLDELDPDFTEGPLSDAVTVNYK